MDLPSDLTDLLSAFAEEHVDYLPAVMARPTVRRTATG